jgi:hypothetical protein
MTITSQTTRQGKVIHLLSLGDLVDAVESGQRLRAYCPIHSIIFPHPLCDQTRYDECPLRHLFHDGNKTKWPPSWLSRP